MKTFLKKILCVTLVALLPQVSVAGTIADLKNFHKSYSGATNIHGPTVMNTQRSGLYTAGGISSRTPSHRLSPFSISTPAVRGGCTGADAYFGSMSHIKSGELKNFLNAVLTSGANYAFMIGLETLCPTCKKQMDYLNRLATEINGMGVDSCFAAASALGNVLPQSQASHDYLCPQLATATGYASDRAAAHQGCFAKNESETVYSRANENPETKKLLDQFFLKGNLAWMVLKKRSFTGRDSEDDDLREMIMTLSGSLIQAGNAEQGKLTALPSLASDKNLYEALLRGGKASIYRCDTKEDCLNPTRDAKSLLEITEKQSFAGLVQARLESIQAKAKADEGAYTEEERQLITSTRKIPLLKAINAQASHSYVFEIIDLTQYAEIIAVDMLDDYVNEMIDVMRVDAKRFQQSDKLAKQFEQQLIEAKTYMQYRKTSLEQEHSLTMDFVNKLQLIEKMTADEMASDLLQMAKWSARQ